VRELILAPRLGGLAAALVEAATMAMLLWLAARATLARVGPVASRGARPTMAIVALVLVVVAEAVLGAVLAATGLAAQRAPRSLAEQAPGVVLLAWLVALPFLLPRHPP
jgi:sorbitol-specific phosphotransferase system component IIBC